MPSITSQEFADELRRQLASDSTLDLAAAGRGATLALLGQALKALHADDALLLRDVKFSDAAYAVSGNATLGGDDAAQAGNTSYKLKRTNVHLGVLLHTKDGLVQSVAVSCEVLDTAWSFANSFRNLPDSDLRQPFGTVSGPSVLAAFTLSNVRFTSSSDDQSSFNLRGSTSTTKDLDAFRTILKSSPEVEGTVELPQDKSLCPVFKISGVTPSRLTATALFGTRQLVLQDVGVALRSRKTIESPTSFASYASSFNLTGTVSLGQSGVPMTLETPAPIGRDTWTYSAEFPVGQVSLSQAIPALASFFGISGADFEALPGLAEAAQASVSYMAVSITSPIASEALGIKVSSLETTLASSVVWRPPLPILTVKDVSTTWSLSRYGDEGDQFGCLAGTVAGTVEFGYGTDVVAIDIACSVPGFYLEGKMPAQQSISIDSALRYFFGRSIPSEATLKVSGLEFSANIRDQTYYGSALIEGSWPVNLGINTIDLSSLSLGASYEAGKLQASIRGTFVVSWGSGTDGKSYKFFVSAAYSRALASNEWEFRGFLDQSSTIPLSALLNQFTQTTPSWASDIVISELFLGFSTGSAASPSAFSFAGTVEGRWTPTIFDNSLKISINASVTLTKEGNARPGGAVSGLFKINDLEVWASKRFGAPSNAFSFQVRFKEVWVDAQTVDVPNKAGTGSGKTSHQALRIQFGGITLGAALEYLVNLVAPTLGFHLGPPWDALKRIELSRFSLTVDPTEQTVEIAYTVGADILAMRVERVGVRMRRVRGRPSVDLILEGRFLNTTYGPAKPLSWDVISGDPPPAVPGLGARFLELRYLGIGNRIAFTSLARINSVRAALDGLRAALRPPGAETVAPLPTPAAGQPAPTIRYSKDAGYMFGLDLRLMGTVDIAIIFSDPALYGLAIGLAGQKAGRLAGLKFEILYKKVSETVGVFSVALELPSAFRHIELGEVSITIGLVNIDIYTNGDFRVDLGFPRLRDFSRSFAVQVLPFIGRGGVYFAKLGAGTAANMPAITNGTFSPVLELGIGLAVGVGKDVSFGPVSGTAYLQVEIVFEGVLAWFNPTAANTPAAQYYAVRGMAAIHGRVSAELRWHGVSARINLEAYALVSVTAAAYRPMTFRLAARVEVEAELEIGWWTVSFSHAYDLDVSVQIGKVQSTPWALAPGETGLPKQLKKDLGAESKPPPPSAVRWQHLADERRRRSDLPDPASKPNWIQDFKAFADVKTVPVQMVRVVTLTDVPFAWGDVAPANPARPHYRAAFLMLADTGMPAGAQTAEANAARQPGKALDTLVEAMLRWVLGAAAANDSTKVITSGQLVETLSWLNGPAASAALTYEVLAAFVAANFRFDIWLQNSTTGESAQSVMIVPPPPPLSFYDVTDSVFLPFDAALRQKVFCDWYFALAQHVVQAARDELACWTFDFKDSATANTSSLRTIAASFPSVTVLYRVKDGDTLESVAEALGTTAAELGSISDTVADAIKAGANEIPQPIAIGVTPELLARTNADVALQQNCRLTLASLPYAIAIGDTLDIIYGRFFPKSTNTPLDPSADNGTNTPIDQLADKDKNTPAVPPADKDTNILLDHLADDVALLRADATFPILPRNVPSFGATLTPRMVQAFFYVRYSGIIDVPHADRYLAMLMTLNPQVTSEGGLSPKSTLTLPLSSTNEKDVLGGYKIQPGDTLGGLAALLALAIDFGEDGSIPGWAGFRADCGRDQTNPIAGYANVKVKPRETLRMLAQRVTLSDTVPASFGSLDILAPLHVITLPPVTHVVQKDETISSLAAQYGMNVGDFAGAIKDVEGLFSYGTTLRVHHLLAQWAPDLINAVLGGPATGRIATQMSRQMLGGIRLPKTDASGQQSVDLFPLFDLIGQQTDVRTLFGMDGSFMAQLQVSVYLDDEQWVTSKVDNYFTILSADILAEMPATTFAVPGKLPAAMKLDRASQRTYGLDRHIDFQAAGKKIVDLVRPPLVMPTIWALPAALREKAKTDKRQDKERPFYRLCSLPVGGDSASATLLKTATFGSMISLRIRCLADVEGIYELIGAAAEHRHMLLDLCMRTDEDAATEDAAFLLAAPAPDAKNTKGLALVAAADEEDKLVILQTNLSTYTVSADSEKRDTGAQSSVYHYALLSDVRQFLRLLWEGSTVGGRGYYLAGKTLGASMFDSNGTAELTLLVILSPQRSAADKRQLHATDNCVVVEEFIDPSSTALYLEAEEDDQDLVRQAIVPPGRAGFTLTIDRPRRLATDKQDSDVRLRQMFSQLAYTVKPGVGGAVPTDLASAHPISPLADGVRSATTPAPSWRYEEVIDTAPYGPTPQVGNQALPDPAKNPYRCVGKSINVDFEFVDLFGNTSKPSDDSAALALPVRYTDPLVPVAAWPGVGLVYSLWAGPTATLTVTAAMSAGFLMPGSDRSPASTIAEAVDVAKRYAEIYYQISQADVTADVQTTLAEMTPQPVPVESLKRLAAANYLYAAAVASMRPIRPGEKQATTLQEVIATYGVTIEAIANANLDVPLREIFGATATLTLPSYVVFAEGETADSIAATAKARGVDLLGKDLLAASSGNAALPKAADLPLRPNVILNIPTRSYAVLVVPGPPPPDTSLADAASGFNIPPGLLAYDNRDVPLFQNLRFVADGVTVTTTGTLNTLQLVVESFAQLGVHVSPADLANGHETEAIFAYSSSTDSTPITSGHYGAMVNDTIQEIGLYRFESPWGAPTDPAGLAGINTSVPNLFEAGTRIWIKDVSTSLADEHGTLREVALRYGLPPATLLTSQISTVVPAGASLVVPGAFAGASEALYALRNYLNIPTAQPSPPQTITSMAGGLSNAQAKAYAHMNRALTGCVAANRTVQFKNASTVTLALDTLNSLYSRLVPDPSAVDFDEFIAGILELPYFLAAGFLNPPLAEQLPISVQAPDRYVSPVFPLEVDLTVARNKDLVYDAFQPGDQSPRIATSTVPPMFAAETSPTSGDATASRTLLPFATNFHKAFPNLRLATGKIDEGAADLWVVAFDASGIKTMTVTPNEQVDAASNLPRTFAIQPLAKHLVTLQNVQAKVLNENGTLGEKKAVAVQSFDAEVWGRTFLIDLERFLSGPYATGAYRAAPDALAKVLKAKMDLAAALASGLAPVLTTTVDPEALADAKERLRQRAAVNLLRAHETSAVVQFDTSVSSAWTASTTRLPARLVGRLAPFDPEFAFTSSDSKLPLQTAKGYMSFLIDLHRGGWSRGVADTNVVSNSALKFDVDLKLREFESNIATPIEGVRYESSDWLTIIDTDSVGGSGPALQFKLRGAEIPIPLRALPETPILVSQSAAPSFPQPQLEQTKLWTFTLTYAHVHSPQDVVFLDIVTNDDGKVAEDSPGETTSIINDLAAYAAVADDLWALLADLVLPDVAPGSRPANAAAAFSEHAHDIASSWTTAWQQKAETKRGTDPALHYTLRSRFKSGGGAVVLDALVVTATDGTPTDSWPSLSVQGTDGVAVQLVQQPQVVAGGETMTYAPPADTNVPAGRLAVTLTWQSLDVFGYRNVRAGLAVERNARLLGDSGPETADAFKYRTVKVKGSSPVTPDLVWTDLPINALKTDLTTTLADLLLKIFGSTMDLLVTMDVSYEFPLTYASDEGPLFTTLPALFFPNHAYVSGSVFGSTATTLSSEMTQWLQRHGPPTTGARWILSLVARHSEGDPLLTISNLKIALR